MNESLDKRLHLTQVSEAVTVCAQRITQAVRFMATERTSDKILNVTQELIQTRGYSAISFDDIARRVGIKKPSIVHHFSNKAALVAAVVERYRSGFLELLKAQGVENNVSHNLLVYFTPYLQFGESGDQVCLCGALAGEFAALPDAVQSQVSDFFNEQKAWLKDQVSQGQSNGEIKSNRDPAATAGWILNTLQGALLIKRATGDAEHVIDAVETIKAMLGIKAI
ncbi:TetR/AcrR family transcriptional regulator [Sessilibacter corallicola]|uniref:TetR/AcrR family transcriptional regulator n=1 Tax=Sessilibacter corallicola TaxID=2904075 RepID=UPI001E61B0C5|nr:TetR/AcrR family transcriptional regulator [Sessilibacter corallicola]